MSGTRASKLEVPSDRDASGRSLGDEELALLAEVVRSGALNSNGGRFVRRFEEQLARFTGARYAIACASGSLAVQAAVFAARHAARTEVVTSPITDFGAIAAIAYEGLRPRFCDVDPATLMPTPETIDAAIGPETAAVVCTHLFGRPARVAEIADVCAARKVPWIEDAAQALGSLHQGRAAGTFGALGAFSFQQSKTITCGEGGAVVTDDAALARTVRLYVNKAWPYGEAEPDHLFRAPNGRMTELQAAVLIAQIEKLPRLLEQRRTSAAALLEAASARAGGPLEFPPLAGGDRHAFWRIALRASRELAPQLAELAAAVAARGIPCQAHYVGRPAFALKALRDAGHDEQLRDFPGVADALARVLVLPWNERIDASLAREIGSVLRDEAEALVTR